MNGSSEMDPNHPGEQPEIQASGCCGGSSEAAGTGAVSAQASLPVVSACSSETSSCVQPVSEVVLQPVAEVAPVVQGAAEIRATEGSTAVVATPAPAPVQAEAQVAPVAAPTATATIEPPHATPTLADAVANDIAAALASAQRARSRAKSNSRGPRPSDLIEKKIVIRRDRWDSLIRLTDTLQAERAVKADPSEVAAIVLEAGLSTILEEARASAAAASRPVKAKATRKRARAHQGDRREHRGAKSLKGKARGKAAARAPKPTRAAPARARTFSGTEIAEIRSLVRGLRSDRSVQRTLALWLGAHVQKGSLAVPIEDLRSLCREFKVYDTANFAQNMKKDAAYFTEVRDRSGDRLGYSLTAAGVAASSGLFATK